PVLDEASALRRIRGNRQLYGRLLESFRTQHSNAAEEIQSLIRAQKWPEAERAAHSMKSISGNIGATPLSRAAREIESALRKGQHDTLEKLLGDFGSALSQVLGSIPCPQIEPKAPARPQESAQNFDAALNKLEELL